MQLPFRDIQERCNLGTKTSRNKTNQERQSRNKTNQEQNKLGTMPTRHSAIQEQRQLGTMSSRNKDIQERNHLGTIFNEKIKLGTIFGYRLSPTFFYKKQKIVHILRTQKSFLVVRDIQERFFRAFSTFHLSTRPQIRLGFIRLGYNFDFLIKTYSELTYLSGQLETIFKIVRSSYKKYSKIMYLS